MTRTTALPALATALLLALVPGADASSQEPATPADAAQGPGHAGDSTIPDPAQVLADRVEAALGGREAWEKTRFLSFGFAERRMHWWDRYTGRHRLEGSDREGRKYLVLHDVDDRGRSDVGARAWLDGKAAEGDALAELVENAYAAWINDTYRLLAPYKLRDPGVTLSHAGTETIDGVEYEKLALSFAGVGLTPGDRYWLYVHPETSRVDRWAYVLEGPANEDGAPPPTAWEWRGWQQMGTGIRLAPERVQVGGESSGRQLSLAPVSTPAELPDAAFESPEWTP